jgi:hypothetical protein
MSKIEQILDKYDSQKRTEKSKLKIEEVESKVNFKLPEDYKFFAKNYIENEYFIGDNFFRLWDFDELLEINNDYGILKNLTNTIGIGENGSSEFIAIELLENNEYRIVLSPFIDLDKFFNIEIGKSFTNFFERLEKGIDWFK